MVVASVRGLWSGTVTVVDADAVRIAGSGSPGTVDLVVRADRPTAASSTVEGTVEGPLATVGAAVLAAAVRRTAEDLLAGLAARARSGRGVGVRHRRSRGDGRRTRSRRRCADSPTGIRWPPGRRSPGSGAVAVILARPPGRAVGGTEAAR